LEGLVTDKNLKAGFDLIETIIIPSRLTATGNRPGKGIVRKSRTGFSGPNGAPLKGARGNEPRRSPCH
jgi:hypothetical protein